MDIKKLERAIVDGLEDVKAQDILVFDTERLSPLFERVIIASGTSNLQTKALASSVVDAVREAGFPKPRVEGEDNGEWIIVDCGAAVAHIMQPAIRQYYHLEEIWGGKPVKMKLGDGKAGGLVKASEPMDADDEAVPKAVAKKAPARKAAAAKKPAAKVAAGKGAAAKAPARKSASGKAAAKPVAKPAAKKAPAKKPATNKVVATKTVVVKPGRPGTAAAKKPVAKKAAPTRKTSR